MVERISSFTGGVGPLHIGDLDAGLSHSFATFWGSGPAHFCREAIVLDFAVSTHFCGPILALQNRELRSGLSLGPSHKEF